MQQFKHTKDGIRFVIPKEEWKHLKSSLEMAGIQVKGVEIGRHILTVTVDDEINIQQYSILAAWAV